MLREVGFVVVFFITFEILVVAEFVEAFGRVGKDLLYGFLMFNRDVLFRYVHVIF